LVSVQIGQAHPAFPATILQYHLLTEAQLDDLMHFYHQRTPGPFGMSYPAPIVTRWRHNANIEDKRRRFGRFMGLRGCESPVSTDFDDVEFENQDEMNRWVERRIQQGIDRENEREMWRQKGY